VYDGESVNLQVGSDPKFRALAEAHNQGRR